MKSETSQERGVFLSADLCQNQFGPFAELVFPGAARVGQGPSATGGGGQESETYLKRSHDGLTASSISAALRQARPADQSDFDLEARCRPDGARARSRTADPGLRRDERSRSGPARGLAGTRVARAVRPARGAAQTWRLPWWG